ncbi:hypothetical protein K438DRAFT_1964098 [Mycena galopus ATCC 62051]|nr:hypothetical protein K438DRAFT_1964098 [Mycena galopus ATCC 62051]
MFFSASIALPFLVSLALSGVAVYSAPVARQDPPRQVCTGPSGTGTCVPLANGQCFNIAPGNAGSLTGDLNCLGYPNPDCVITVQDILDENGVRDLSIGGADNLVGNGDVSVQC